jgi:hypothetical protein
MGEGSFTAVLAAGETYYALVDAVAADYVPTAYNLSVTETAAFCYSGAESFEMWPPPALAVDNSGGAAWSQASSSSYPTGASPTDGAYMARFNSFSASSGSTANLTTSVIDLSCATTVMLSFDMYHDTGYTTNADRILVRYSTGGSFADAAPAINRYDGTTGWQVEMIDLTSALAGQATAEIRLHGISAYGNDIYIDNLHVLGD